jgi:mono/diheme cytochrome c family protein
MMRRLFIFISVLALAAGSAQAQTTAKKGPMKGTAITGDAMFKQYCVSCHGATGKGDGPYASNLVKPPSDLTKISARNGGTFPDVKVRRYIEGADEVAAHGSRDMPLWGDLFKGLDRDMAQIRLNVLTEHVKGMQTK